MSAAAGDEELESLLRNFHRFSQGYKDAIMEAQALRVNYSSESKKREALESHIADLKRGRRIELDILCCADNERLRKLYTETLFKFTNQEYKREIEQLKHDSEMNCNALESKLSCALAQRATDEATIGQLKSDLGAHRAHIDMLGGRLEQVTAEVHMQYKNDIQDLNDVIMVEQEEKNDMQRKLKSAENELRIMKMKQAEQQRDSVSVQHVESLKQKVMKLRKENESLKRRLASSELNCS
ncbi:hypothetical protein ACQ4PT_038821 [Festuca glaucescens]